MKRKLVMALYKLAVRRGLVSDSEKGMVAPFAFDVKVGFLRVWDYGWDCTITVTYRARTLLIAEI